MMSARKRNIAFYLGTLFTLGAAILGLLAFGTELHGRSTLTPTWVSPTASGGLPDPSPFLPLAANLQSPLGILLLQLVAVIVCARGIGWLFRKIGQPSVIGEVVAGILLGPSLMGWLAPSLYALVFPSTSLEILRLFSQVGVILFMFTVGVSVDLTHLRQRAQTAVLVSHASIILPFFLGVALAIYIFPAVARADTSFVPFALFMGVAMSITAFPVLARIVSERGLARSPLGHLVIASSAIDDVTAWCLLGVVVAIIKGRGLADAGVTVALVAAFIAAVLIVVRPRANQLFAVTPEGHGRIGRVSAVLAFALVCALFTETIGIHALFGAFLSGVAVSSAEGMRRFVKSRLETVTSVILLPLFFAFTGLRTNVGLIGDWHSLILFAAVITVAVAGKLGGSSLAARWTGMSWFDSLSIGILMNTRGLVELIALNIGYELGILTPLMFTIMVLMALITTLMAGPSLAFLSWVTRRASAPVLDSAAAGAASS